MGKKNQEIATLKAEINELQKRMCTDVILTLTKYCSLIEKNVNDPKFVHGSLKLMPRVAQSDAVDGVAAGIEIVMAIEHDEFNQNKLSELKDEIAFLKYHNNLLKSRLDQLEK